MRDGQAARISTEWRRWEEADKWSWDADKRRRWAERLWRGQVMRHGARMRARVEAAASAARQRVDVRHRMLCLIARTTRLVFCFICFVWSSWYVPACERLRPCPIACVRLAVPSPPMRLRRRAPISRCKFLSHLHASRACVCVCVLA